MGINKIIVKAFFCCWVFTALASYSLQHQTHYQDFQPKESHQLRVASYNLNWGDVDWKLKNVPMPTIAAIQAVDADVFLLQECSPKWQKLINHYLAKQYKYREFSHFFHGKGVAILSKYPITTKQYIAVQSGWCPAWDGYISTPLGKIQFVDVHLLPIRYEAEGMEGVKPYSIVASSTLREKEFRWIFSQIDSAVPTMIAGDFNESDAGVTVNFLRKQGYFDTFRLIKKPSYTWHWPLKIVTLAGHIDYIFYTPHVLQAVRTQVLHEGSSDHYPIAADFIKL